MLAPGAVLVADRGLCSYAQLALLVQAGVHAVIRVGVRQMGKSSLMVHTVVQLEKQRIGIVIIDLQGKIERGMAAEAFYAGLIDAFPDGEQNRRPASVYR
jgi:hypothetical protein